MSNAALDTEYENGVADVLAFVAGSGAKVERNVHLAGIRSGKPHQIDVLVTTSVVGLGETRIAVDCKRWKRTINIPGIQQFQGLLEDIAVDGGLIISTSGSSEGALTFCKQAMGVRIDVLTLEELAQWRPPDTVHLTTKYLPASNLMRCESCAAPGSVCRVIPVSYPDQAKGAVIISAFQHFGTTNPSGEVQS